MSCLVFPAFYSKGCMSLSVIWVLEKTNISNDNDNQARFNCNHWQKPMLKFLYGSCGSGHITVQLSYQDCSNWNTLAQVGFSY